MTRSEILLRLAERMCLESGLWMPGAWMREEERRVKERKLRSIRCDMRECHKCEGMNRAGVTDVVCPWGDPTSPICFVGQSAHWDGIKTDVPFIMGSGLYVDAALWCVGLTRVQAYWCNAVACHPEKNRPSTSKEKAACLPYLQRTLEAVQPELVVALGNDAKESVVAIEESTGEHVAPRRFFCRHPAALMRGASPDECVNWVAKLAEQLSKVL